MSMFEILRPTAIAAVPEKHFLVVHPLDDVRETLMALRGYLVLMILLVLYHVMDLAGVFGQQPH